jgi:hypothetical protein
MWTSRRDLLKALEGRLSVLARAKPRDEFLWPELRSMKSGKLPKSLRESEKAAWLKQEYDKAVAARHDALQGFIELGGELTAEHLNGELRLLSDGKPVLQNIFVKPELGTLVRQYWRFVISRRSKEAKTFARELASYPLADETDAAPQFMARVDQLLALNIDILAHERRMNDALYDLYDLSTDERQLIEDDCALRPLL